MSEGPHINAYGDVTSSASVVEGAPKSNTLRGVFTLVRGQIKAVFTADDPKNNEGGKGRYTLYDVLTYDQSGSTELIRRCRMLQPGFGGGFTNFFEIVPTDPGPDLAGKEASELKRGTHVLVAFISGNKQAGIILGALPHPSEVATKTRPKKKNATHLEGEFQGFNFKIENDGSMTLTMGGPKTDLGVPMDPSVGPTVLKVDKTGSINIETNQQQKFTIDRVKKQITCQNGLTKWVMSQTGGKIEITGQELTVKTTKDVKVEAMGKATVKALQDVLISSATAIKLARGGAAPEPFVLGNQFKILMTELLGAIAGITSIGNLGAPTTPPLNAPQFLAMIPRLEMLLSKLISGAP
jgi:hypothetical protein